MNIPLSHATAAAASSRKKAPKKNVLQSASSEDDSGNDDVNDKNAGEDTPAGGRAAVNRALIREQDAIRAKVRAAEAADDTGLYDYDGAYDSFHSNNQDGASSSQQQQQQSGSRYIGELLQAAERRQRERDVVHERRVAREQAAEEAADPSLRGKEMFVTAAYKKQLEERKLWQAREKQEERRAEEEASNVTTRRGHQDGMANFYSNLNRNVALGGNQVKTPQQKQPATEPERNDNTIMPGFVDGFAKDATAVVEPNIGSKQEDENGKEEHPEERRKRMRLLREEKVEQARIRYFQRQAAKQIAQP